MSDPVRIADILLAVETEAAALYDALARRFRDRADLCALWAELAKDERAHAAWIREVRRLPIAGLPDLPSAPLLAALDEIKRQRERIERDDCSILEALAATISLETSEVNDTLAEFVAAVKPQDLSTSIATATVAHLRRLLAVVDRLSHPELAALLRGVMARAERQLRPGRTILVVDDETDMLDTCARILRRSGYTCFTTASGQEALALLQRERPNLILTDLRMPRVDGLTLLRRAKELAPEIPVVIFTAYVSEASAREALEAGAAAYLPKPFTASQLRLMVEQTLGGSDERPKRPSAPA